jgi:hypothetical protein
VDRVDDPSGFVNAGESADYFEMISVNVHDVCRLRLVGGGNDGGMPEYFPNLT